MKKLSFKKVKKILSLISSFPMIVPCSACGQATHSESKNSFPFDENILLSIYWPPTENYINDEQYKLLADAGINWVMGSGEETLCTPENQAKMLQLCAKYGMGMTVSDGNFGDSLLSKSEAEIAAAVKRYENVDGAYGFYMRDEPYNPNQYLDAYVSLKKAAPDKYMHINFLPSVAYPSKEVYKAQMEDWCRLTAQSGYPLDYLMFDRYPFTLQKGIMDRVGFFENLRTCYEVGLKNNVKTGLYIQTVCQEVGFRRPTDSEIRYEMYASLAFGFKQLSFFTWFTPTNRSEPFKDAIISPTGKPNAHYQAVKTLNHEIHAIGSILAKCDALEVYFSGNDTHGQPSVPDNFFVKAGSNDSVILSFLRHKETGRNYLMVVNNDFTYGQNVELTFDNNIKSLWEVSRTNGSLESLGMNGQKVSLDLAAGDATFIALPENYDHYKEETSQPEAKTNLVLDSMIHAPESTGTGGWYISFLQDGVRNSQTYKNGWKSENTSPTYLTIDLGKALNFNRIDLYPAGSMFDKGVTFPANISISVSNDGKSWSVIKTLSDVKINSIKGFRIDVPATKSRYVRMDMSGSNGGSYIALNEIEIYNDDGSVPPPQEITSNEEQKVITYTEGSNIALNKDVYCSSETNGIYEQWGWAPRFINDGVSGNGWTSAVGVNTSPMSSEYIVIDFGDLFSVDRIIFEARGYFPEDYSVELSHNGLDWQVVRDVKGAPFPKDGERLTFDISPAFPARYVRVTATKLRGGGVDGYLFQLGEIEAYGNPICDASALEKAVKQYINCGKDQSDATFKEAFAALSSSTLTQTYADSLAKKISTMTKHLSI